MLLHHRLAMLLALALSHGLLAPVNHFGVVVALLATLLRLLMLGVTRVRISRRGGLSGGWNGEDERQSANNGFHVSSPRNVAECQ
jgi:hypothetical protein